MLQAQGPSFYFVDSQLNINGVIGSGHGHESIANESRNPH